jgi:hypothetical protein
MTGNYTAILLSFREPPEPRLRIAVMKPSPRPCSGNQLVSKRPINFFASGGPMMFHSVILSKTPADLLVGLLWTRINQPT